MSNNHWYVTLDGAERGPASSGQLKQLAAQGKLKPNTPIRRADMDRPVPASKIKGLFPAGGQPSVAAAAPEPEPAEQSVPAAGSVAEAFEELDDDYKLAEVAPSEHQLTAADLVEEDEPDEEDEARLPASRGPAAFFEQVGQAFLYPFKGSGALAIFGLALAIVLFLEGCSHLLPRMLSGMSTSGGSVTMSVGLIKFIMYGLFTIALLVEGYIAAYVFGAGRATTFGDDRPPRLPDLGAFVDEVLMPALMMFGTALLCSLPFLIYAVSSSFEGRMILELMKSGFWGFIGAVHIGVLATPDDVVGWMLYAIGGIYYPMALACLMITGNPASVDPRVVVPAIRAVAKVYPVVLVIVHLKGYLWYEFVFKNLFSDMRVGSSVFIPAVLLLASAIYLLVFQSRVLGMLYRCHRRELAFVEQ